MQIETYEIEEINSSEASTMAADSEAIALIEQLGLEGQRKLSNPDTATRFPYPRLSAQQEAVFGTLFPGKSEVKAYAQGIIPLRVLQVIAFCKDQPQTRHLEIWHAESVKEDPILVGMPTKYGPTEKYLLARWGDSLLPFDELCEKAMTKAQTLFESEYSNAASRIKGYMDNVKVIARKFIATGDKPQINIWD